MFSFPLFPRGYTYIPTLALVFLFFHITKAENLSNTTVSRNDTSGTIITSTLTTSKDGRIHGWVEQPNARGTIDIVWTCLFSIFISTYTMLCLNVPAVNDPLWKIIGRKVLWMSIAIAGPEFVLTAASGQWGTARESVKMFHASGYTQWTMRHGFFADMGGFLLMPRDSPPFPITSRHLHWLVEHKYLPFPEVTAEEMEDKSKQDTIAKVITVVQVGYLILQCLGRAIQGLAITSLELFALAIVICSIMTAFCWLRKPLDVRTPIKLIISASTEEILRDAGDAAAKPWDLTPLDFVDDLRPTWNYNVQAFIHMTLPPYERPVPRFGNDRFPNLRGDQETYLCIATLVYAAIHLIGWNFSFPTRLELILWRISSMFLFGTTVVFWIFETVAAWHRKGRWSRLFYRIFKPSQQEAAEKARIEQEANRKPKPLPLPAEFWSILPLAILYGVARMYLLVEVFLGLRSLEPSAFYTVDWTAWIPHV